MYIYVLVAFNWVSFVVCLAIISFISHLTHCIPLFINVNCELIRGKKDCALSKKSVRYVSIYGQNRTKTDFIGLLND